MRSGRLIPHRCWIHPTNVLNISKIVIGFKPYVLGAWDDGRSAQKRLAMAALIHEQQRPAVHRPTHPLIVAVAPLPLRALRLRPFCPPATPETRDGAFHLPMSIR